MTCHTFGQRKFFSHEKVLFLDYTEHRMQQVSKFVCYDAAYQRWSKHC